MMPVGGETFVTFAPTGLTNECSLLVKSLKVVYRVCSARTHYRTVHHYAGRAHHMFSFITVSGALALVQSECYSFFMYAAFDV